MTEPEAPADAKRGRPRPDATIERDKRVLEHLAAVGPQKRDDIAKALEMEGKQVYLSLYRLNRDGAILRSGASWSAKDENGAPIAAPASAEAPVAAE
jgi:hypothetical protein